MQLQSFHHPRMVMVSALLTGNNYLAWSRAVKRGLTTKMKLYFIDGTAVKPTGNGGDFKRWNRTDSMDPYFKIHGVPDWYKDLTDQRKKIAGRERGFDAAMTDDKGSTHSEGIPNITDIVQTELKKFMHDEVLLDPFEVNFAQLDDFADIQFHENFFPFARTHSPEDTCPLSTIPLTIDIDDVLSSAPSLDTPAVVSSRLPPTNDIIRNCDSPLLVYRQTSSSPQWVEAMNQELCNKTWVVFPLLARKCAIGCKQVNSGFVGLLVYVNDVLIMAPAEDLISQVKPTIAKPVSTAFMDALVSWKTKKRCMVPLSSAKAEYRSMAATICELKWILYLLRDFGVSAIDPIPLHCDNQTLPGAVFSALMRKLGLFVGSPSPTCGGDVENGTHFLWDPG
ncbi:UNVERIFIED_CONTAM: hypothetical protein Scaly_0260700 [Sesamum calycinum]|uniref:Retrotransposon Copia-like N-terminal domain-containing protein n=1 Tax=Sesamum calycinum TaxID=2727403 RepID=A0AAW2SBF4_9LAMI